MKKIHVTLLPHFQALINSTSSLFTISCETLEVAPKALPCLKVWSEAFCKDEEWRRICTEARLPGSGGEEVAAGCKLWRPAQH